MRLNKLKLKLASVTLTGLLAACSLVADSELKSGVGQSCVEAAECQGEAADCVDGRCVLGCSTADECPAGTSCAADVCDVSFKVGFVYDGNPVDSGFSRAHDEGRLAAKAAVPWLDFALVAQDIQKDQEAEAMSGLIADGAEVIFVTTTRFGSVAQELAADNPNVRFLNFGIPSWDGGNFSGYVPRYHQAWYLSGVALASFAGSLPASDTKRHNFGFIGALPVPEVIAQLNAFTLGARSVDPEAKVDVVWLAGFVPADGQAERAVDYLIEDGNRFLINRIGARNSAVINKLETLNKANGDDKIYTAVLDNADCTNRGDFCLGGPTWNWGPLYTRIVQEIQHGTFDSALPIRDSIQSDPKSSVINLTLNPAQQAFSGTLRDQLSQTIQNLTKGGDNTFAPKGSLTVCATDPDQRPQGGCVKTRVEDDELGSMCWLVEGVVQRKDPNAPFDAADNPLVEALTPDGDLWPPANFGGTPISLSCN